MKKLLIGILAFTSISLFASSADNCSGFINRLVLEDIQVNVDFSKCDFGNSSKCLTQLEYDDVNKCSGSGENAQCTEAQGLGLLDVELIKKGKKITVKKIINSYDFNLSDVTYTTKKIKRKLSFKLSDKAVYMKYGFLRTKMNCN
jgi:hypothetical protein